MTLSHDACEGRCTPPTWYPGDALQAAEAGAASVAMATPKKELGVYFFFLSKQSNLLEEKPHF